MATIVTQNKYQEMIDFMAVNLPDIKISTIRAVLRAFVVVVNENAAQNEPTYLKKVGLFGVYSYKVKVNPSRFGNGNAQRGRNAWKSNQDWYRGATHYRVNFRCSKFMRGVLN